MVGFVVVGVYREFFFRCIEDLPEALFRQLLFQKNLFLDCQLLAINHSLGLRTNKGMKIMCKFDTVEAMDALTESILQNYPQGISTLESCPEKILKTVISINPEGVHSFYFK